MLRHRLNGEPLFGDDLAKVADAVRRYDVVPGRETALEQPVIRGADRGGLLRFVEALEEFAIVAKGFRCRLAEIDPFLSAAAFVMKRKRPSAANFQMVLEAGPARIDERAECLIENLSGIVDEASTGVAAIDNSVGHLLLEILQRLGELRSVPFGRVLRVRRRMLALRRDIATGLRVGFAAQRAFVEVSVLDPARVFIGHVSFSRFEADLSAAPRSGGSRKRF
jgi:hypothetical protein